MYRWRKGNGFEKTKPAISALDGRKGSGDGRKKPLPEPCFNQAGKRRAQKKGVRSFF
jgi:hypothetical protein